MYHTAMTDAMSVGGAMRDAPVLSINHPSYRAVVDAISAEVSSQAQKDFEQRVSASPVVFTQLVEPELLAEVEKEFPELRIISYGMEACGHSRYQAFAAAGNALMLSYAAKLASSAVHLGGTLLGSLVVPKLDVHVEADFSVPFSVHERSRDMRNTLRVMGDYAALAAEGDFAHARNRYDEYLQRGKYITCASGSCTVAGEVYCVDVARYPISPAQFVAGAVQSGATVAFAMIPYHPQMLVKDSGEIPDTGVFFEKDYDAGVLRLKYPEGVCGAEVFSLNDWGAWLVEHGVAVGRGDRQVQFHFQLIKRRGPFMLVQATRSPFPVEGAKLRHALDLEVASDQYVVSGWRLRDLVADPDEFASWENFWFLAPKHVVDKIYAFGMQLSPENFSRYALRKQLAVYDRVTLEGTTITKGFRPGSDELDTLVTMLYAELFVKRFESGQLSKELMARLKAVAGFSKAGFWAKVRLLATWCALNAWNNTLGHLTEAFMGLVTWLENWFRTGINLVEGPSFHLAPTKVTFETLLTTWRDKSFSVYKRAVKTATEFRPGNDVSLRGGALADAIAVRQRTRMLASVQKCLVNVVHVAVDDGDSSKTSRGETVTNSQTEELMGLLSQVNPMDAAGLARHVMPAEVAVRVEDPEESMRPDQDVDPDYVATLNDVYEVFNPGMNEQPLHVDTASLSHDPQDRHLAADFMRMPRLTVGSMPKNRRFYKSKVLALGAPKRQETGPELLSAVAARNLAPPKVSLPQDNSKLIPQVFERFLDTMCVADAREKLKYYQSDSVGLEETAYRDWIAQSKPGIVARVLSELKEADAPMTERDVGRYLMMLKADVKPTLSNKPMHSRTEPQVIVYHEKATSSMYSSVFRVLVRRFMSLLKSNVHVNLLKDMDDIKKFLQAVHPFGEKLRFVENDFSKYDKSQDEFVFELEQYVFAALGMNEGLLDRWLGGHEECSLFSFSTGLSLHLRFQRKSGDATTAFGNVLLNIMSVSYAYGLSDYAWALFMGDDSLMATGASTVDSRAVQVLAEVFNLTAKTFITDQPYYASWFFMFDEHNHRVVGLPDPIKRIEKWSQPISADDPQWHERYVSASQTCAAYSYKMNTHWLGEMVAKRYQLPVHQANRLAAAVYTACSSEEKHRAMYDEQYTEFLV